MFIKKIIFLINNKQLFYFIFFLLNIIYKRTRSCLAVKLYIKIDQIFLFVFFLCFFVLFFYVKHMTYDIMSILKIHIFNKNNKFLKTTELYIPGAPGKPFCASSPSSPFGPSIPENKVINQIYIKFVLKTNV